MGKVIIVRDGSAGFSYIGMTHKTDEEILDKAMVGGMIKLTNVRVLQTFTVQLAPGVVGQDVHIFPIDGELGPVDYVWVKPASFHYPSESGEKSLAKLLKQCEENETKMRVQREAGLVI